MADETLWVLPDPQLAPAEYWDAIYNPTPEQCAECLRDVLLNYALGDTGKTIQ